LRYRGRAGIVYDILKALSTYGPMPMSRLMTAANLPYDRFKDIVKKLVSKGLIEERREGDKVIYTLRGEGFKALEELERVKKLMEELGLRL